MKEDFTIENPATEAFELITINEFDSRMRSVKPWLKVFEVFMLLVPIAGLIAIAINANEPEFEKVAILFLVSWLISIAISFVAIVYICRKPKICCPYCKRTLSHEFRSFRGYVRSRGKNFLNSNPFINGQCPKCKKVIIETDQRLNDCLRQRKAQMNEKHSSASVICCFVGLVAFFAIVFSVPNSGRGNDPKNRSGYMLKARRHILAGDFKEAKKTLAIIHAKQPNYSTVNELLGFIFLQQDEFEKALFYYQKALPYSTEVDKVNNAISIINQKLKDKQ